MSDLPPDGPANRESTELTELTRLLDDPAVWAMPSSGVENDVIAAIAAERDALAGPDKTPFATEPATDGTEPATDGTEPATDGDPEPKTGDRADPDQHTVVDLDQRRAERARRHGWPLAVAAALLLVTVSAAAGFAMGRGDNNDLEMVALAPTDLAPGASVVATIDEQPNGARLVLEIAGLEPAPPGSYYEAWLVRDQPRTIISAGTFHMRGSEDGEIELWAGVSTTAYPTITITLQSEADPRAPGELLLRGEIESS